MVEGYLVRGVTMVFDVATESFYLRLDGNEDSLASPYIDGGGLGFTER
jgi:hypothetical protein